MDMNQYINIFIEESNEHLQNMNDSLLRLENEPDNKELLNEIFRVSHTLKGMSATMGFEKMSSLTHEMENLLHELRNDNIIINTEIIDTLFACFDLLEKYVEYISENGNEGNINSSDLVDKLHVLIKGNESRSETEKTKEKNENYNIDPYVINVINKANAEGLNGFKIRIILDDSCMLKAARAFIVFNKLEEFSEVIKSNPSAEDIEDENFEREFEIIVLSKKSSDDIKSQLEEISELKKIQIRQIEFEKKNNPDYSNNNKNLDNNKKADNITKNKKSTKNKAISNKVGKTVRVDIERLDNLMNLVSELIIIKTRMEEIGDKNEKQSMDEATEYLERITTNLHDAVMKVRMVPIERVFNRFPRMVRDLSKELGKKISLKMSGEDTEVDRTVIDEIGDPLIHLIRNSIDHGIETPEDRKMANKDELGTVYLRSYPDGNNVVIEVQDDGSGINIDAVKNKAINNNVISEERANQMDDNEVPELLFMPGFSTAEEITDISGRGVGLDVVKSKIESIGGIVEVSTKKNKGTKFTIRIPLTLAIIQALLIKLSNEIYAIPLNSIKEISHINNEDIKKVQGQEVVLFRNKTLPIIRLSEVLGVESTNKKQELTTVIVKKGEKEAGLIIDELLGQQEIVIKSLGKYLSNVKNIAGATVLGNGRISLILDINSLF